VLDDELVCLARDIRELGQPVVAGFSTHPHWDHLLWHADLGDAPRYGTARCAATVQERLPDAAAIARVAQFMPPDIVDRVPLDLLGRITGLPAGATDIPWDGPHVRIIEHQAHAAGHAALLIEDRGVLVAGDMASDGLIPILDFSSPADPIEDYLAALELLERTAAEIDAVIPGHGSVGGADELHERIARDRAYVQGLRDAAVPDDPRLSSPATFGKDFSPGVHARQLDIVAERQERDGTSG
jgi:glyoxylase-like metal-dependent hydrolase (beta-lactamase superfamily II)